MQTHLWGNEQLIIHHLQYRLPDKLEIMVKKLTLKENQSTPVFYNTALKKTYFVASSGVYVRTAPVGEPLAKVDARKVYVGEEFVIPPNHQYQMTSFYDEHGLVDCHAVLIETTIILLGKSSL